MLIDTFFDVDMALDMVKVQFGSFPKSTLIANFDMLRQSAFHCKTHK